MKGGKYVSVHHRSNPVPRPRVRVRVLRKEEQGQNRPLGQDGTRKDEKEIPVGKLNNSEYEKNNYFMGDCCHDDALYHRVRQKAGQRQRGAQ